MKLCWSVGSKRLKYRGKFIYFTDLKITYLIYSTCMVRDILLNASYGTVSVRNVFWFLVLVLIFLLLHQNERVFFVLN